MPGFARGGAPRALEIAAGRALSLALADDGLVYGFGRLGDGECARAPRRLACFAPGAVAVAADIDAYALVNGAVVAAGFEWE